MVGRLEVGETNLPGMPTTVMEAVQQTDEFIRKMAMQEGRARVETEQAAEAEKWKEVVEENVWSLLLTALGVSGLGAAGVGKAVQIYMNTKKAVKDACATGEELATAMTPEEVRMVKKKHAEIQKKNGTKKIIEAALA